MSASSYEKVRELGKGSYGIVYEVKNKDDDRFAMKINNTEDCYGGTIYSLKEMDILYRGHYNHVVRLIESPYNNFLTKTEDKICMILEKGEMDGHGFIYKKVSIKEKKLFFLHTLLALEFLHSRGIIHGDVKPSNMIVFLNEDGSFLNAKITDFSISTFITNQRSPKHCIVTAHYRPPEVCVKSFYNEKIDVWSAGIMGLEIFMKGKHRLFSTDKDKQILRALTSFIVFHPELKEQVENIYGIKAEQKNTIEGTLKLKPSDIYDFNCCPGSYTEFLDVLSRSLETSVNKRASISQLLEMPFFYKYKDIITNCRKETDINSEGVWILKPTPMITVPSSEIRGYLLRFAREVLLQKQGKYMNGTTFLFLLMCIDRYVRDSKMKDRKEDYLIIFNCLLVISIKYIYSLDIDIQKLFHQSEGFQCDMKDVVKFEREILSKVFIVDIWEESYHSCMRRIAPLSSRKLFLLLDRLSSLKEGSYYINDILTKL